MAVAAAYLQANTTRKKALAGKMDNDKDRQRSERSGRSSVLHFHFPEQQQQRPKWDEEGETETGRGSWRESSEFAAGHCRELSTERAETIERERERMPSCSIKLKQTLQALHQQQHQTKNLVLFTHGHYTTKHNQERSRCHRETARKQGNSERENIGLIKVCTVYTHTHPNSTRQTQLTHNFA